MKNTVFPHKFEHHSWIECIGYVFDPDMCGLQYIEGYSHPHLMPNSSSQSAELIVYIIPPE